MNGDHIGYDVIGATLRPRDDELPIWLRPVLRTCEQPYRYALVYDRDGEDALVPEDAAEVAEYFEGGRFHRFEAALPYWPGYWLVQLEANEPPIYLPANDARKRVREAGERALREAAEAVAAHDTETASRRAAYATRALEDDPFPCLAQIALLRPRVTESQLWLKQKLLGGFDAMAMRSAFRAARSRSELAPLVQLVTDDPTYEEYNLAPSWFPKRSANWGPPSGFWRSPVQRAA